METVNGKSFKSYPAIVPYNAGLTLEEVRTSYHVNEISKLGSNENPLGPSPRLRGLFPDIGAFADTMAG